MSTRCWQDSVHVVPWKFNPSLPPWAHRVRAGENQTPTFTLQHEEAKAWYSSLFVYTWKVTQFQVRGWTQNMTPTADQLHTPSKPLHRQKSAGDWVQWPGQKTPGPWAPKQAAAAAMNSPASKTQHSPSAAQLTTAGPLPRRIQSSKVSDNHFIKASLFFFPLLPLDYWDQHKLEEGRLQTQHLLWRQTQPPGVPAKLSLSVCRRFADTRPSGIRAAANICLSALYYGWGHGHRRVFGF